MHVGVVGQLRIGNGNILAVDVVQLQLQATFPQVDIETTRDVEPVTGIVDRAVVIEGTDPSDDVEAALERALEDRDWQVRQAAEDMLGPGTTGDGP